MADIISDAHSVRGDFIFLGGGEDSIRCDTGKKLEFKKSTIQVIRNSYQGRTINQCAGFNQPGRTPFCN